MIAPIEEHTDKSKWVKCIPEEPKPGKLWNGLHVYHGDAKIIGGSYDGSDDEYECPNCKDHWWVEYDG